MARALLLALTCAAAASAARYVDYSGVKMPAYGSGGDYEAPRDAAAAQHSDDYHGHSPDAPASLDYKYEAEPRIKTETLAKDSDDPEVWRKSGRKQRGLMRPVDSANADDGNKYERDEEEVPKFRSSHRYPKHRSRLKNDVPSREEESPPRRPIKYSRDRKDDVSDINRKDYFQVDKDDFPDDKSKEFDEESKFVNEATTRRVNRRKPRDRHIKRKSSELVDMYDDELETDPRMKGDSDKGPVPRRTRPPELRARERFRPMTEDEDEDLTKVQPLNKQKQKTYEDYDDYYDMKRVYSIKSKLPTLLRRTTESVTRPTGANVAERELKAALGARRTRKEAGEAEPPPPAAPFSSTSLVSLATFPAAAVPPGTHKQWSDFIAANNSQRLQISMFLIFLALINCLQRYEYRDILVTNQSSHSWDR